MKASKYPLCYLLAFVCDPYQIILQSVAFPKRYGFYSLHYP